MGKIGKESSWGEGRGKPEDYILIFVSPRLRRHEWDIPTIPFYVHFHRLLIACDTSSDTRGNTVGILYAVIRLDSQHRRTHGGADSQHVIPLWPFFTNVFSLSATMSHLAIMNPQPSLTNLPYGRSPTLPSGYKYVTDTMILV